MKLVSLFTGAMGLDLGLEAAGFETSVCVENDSLAVETIRLNRPRLPVIEESIVQMTGERLIEVGELGDDPVLLVAGGPPCQAFSMFGNREGIYDSRGRLVFEFIRIVSELQPHVFVMENVRGLLSMSLVPKSKKGELDNAPPGYFEKGSLLKRVFSGFADIGYRVDCFVVNAVNYGAPQNRERLILIGNRHDLLSCFPGPRYSNRPEDGLPPFKTLGEVIGDGFEDPCPEVLDFSPRKLRYVSMVPQGGNWRSLPEEIQEESMGKSYRLKGGRSAYWRRLSFDFPSPTVVTMPNHAGTSMCHPTEDRAISVGEAAAIQGFPRDWKFAGSTGDKFRQVGNAVPTKLGQVAGEEVQALLKRIARGEEETNRPPQNRIVHLRPHIRIMTYWRDGKTYVNTSYYEDDGVNARQGRLDPG